MNPNIIYLKDNVVANPQTNTTSSIFKQWWNYGDSNEPGMIEKLPAPIKNYINKKNTNISNFAIDSLMKQVDKLQLSQLLNNPKKHIKERSSAAIKDTINYSISEYKGGLALSAIIFVSIGFTAGYLIKKSK